MDTEDNHIAQKRLHELKEELLAEKEAAAEGTEPVELDQARVGRLSRMDSMQQQAMAVEQDRRRDLQLQRIEGAFQRLDTGTYGICMSCKVKIEDKRMDFDPTAFFCSECAQRMEKK
jgi:DnaK suppressor protein